MMIQNKLTTEHKLLSRLRNLTMPTAEALAKAKAFIKAYKGLAFNSPNEDYAAAFKLLQGFPVEKMSHVLKTMATLPPLPVSPKAREYIWLYRPGRGGWTEELREKWAAAKKSSFFKTRTNLSKAVTGAAEGLWMASALTKGAVAEQTWDFLKMPALRILGASSEESDYFAMAGHQKLRSDRQKKLDKEKAPKTKASGGPPQEQIADGTDSNKNAMELQLQSKYDRSHNHNNSNPDYPPPLQF